MTARVWVYRIKQPPNSRPLWCSEPLMRYPWVVLPVPEPWRPYERPRRFATWAEAMRYADQLAAVS